MQMKKRVSEKVKKVVVKLAKRTASIEANTACLCLNYQPKETESIKQLRKFRVLDFLLDTAKACRWISCEDKISVSDDVRSIVVSCFRIPIGSRMDNRCIYVDYGNRKWVYFLSCTCRNA